MKQKMRLVLAVAFCSLWLLGACGESSGPADAPQNDGDTNDTVEQNENSELESADGDGADTDEAPAESELESADGDSLETGDETPEGEQAEPDADEQVELDSAESEQSEESESNEADGSEVEGEVEAEQETDTEAEAEVDSDDNACACAPYTGTFCLDTSSTKGAADVCSLLDAGILTRVTVSEVGTGCGLRLATLFGANELQHQDITGERCPDLFDGEPQTANSCTLFYSDEQAKVTVTCLDKSASSTCERRFSKDACPEVHCVNHEFDQDESDTDCGGGCAPCDLAAHCKKPQDCTSGDCYNGHCAKTLCPDGHTSGAETCDDNNSQPGDGCNSDCQVEDGFICQGTPSLCKPICGDGLLIVNYEGCDDGGTEANDGCDANCQVESGYTCLGSPSVCRPACVVSADCQAPLHPCLIALCENLGCNIVPRAAGPLPTQTAGDCLRQECDGRGKQLGEFDDADTAESDTTCISYTCANGTKKTTFATSSTLCSDHGGRVCDGQGVCVACVGSGDCPGTDSECQTRTCDFNACGASNKLAGTALTQQRSGDCQRNVCDGNGGTTSVADNNDTPVDGNACTQDLCTSGVPTNPFLPAGASCNQDGGIKCNAMGQCVACLSPSDCPNPGNECKTPTCTAGACGFSFVAGGTPLANQTPGDCQVLQCDGNGGTTSVADNNDTPVDGNTCTRDVCTSGVPTNPPQSARAICNQNGGSMCDGAGQCVGCLSPSDCPNPGNECKTPTCTAGTCGFSFVAGGTPLANQTPGDCQVLQCNGNGGTTSVADNNDTPVDNNACTQDLCIGGIPTNPLLSEGTSCNQDGGIKCNALGQCVGCLSPSDCPGVDNDCKTRTCTAGKCDMSFTASGIPLSSQQTAGDCHTVQCNGYGGALNVIDDSDTPLEDGNACTTEICSNGSPSYPPKGTMAPCGQNGGSMCDGAGHCVQCLLGPDCASGVCVGNVCQQPTCTDNFANGTETGLDCGGSCPNACPKLALAISGGASGVWGAVYDYSGSWRLSLLSPAPGYAEVAMQESGSATLVMRADSSNQILYSNYVPQTATFSALQQLGPGLTARNLSILPSSSGVNLLFHGVDNYALYLAKEILPGLWNPLNEPVGVPQLVGPSGGTLVTIGEEVGLAYIKDGVNRAAFVSRFGGGAWQPPVDVSGGVMTNIWLQPAIVASSSSGELTMVFVSQNSLLYSARRVGGIWSAPSAIPSATSNNRPALLSLPGGGILLVFRGQDGYLYQSTSNDGIWTPPSPVAIPNQPTNSTPALAMGVNGADAELVFANPSGVYHMRRFGGAWQPPTLIMGVVFSQVSLSSRL